MRILIRFVHFQVGSNCRQQQLHDLRVFKKLRRSPSKPSKIADKSRVRQFVKRRIGIRPVRRRTCGNKQQRGRPDASAAQQPRQFKANESPIAVAEQCVWNIEKWNNRLGERVKQRLKASERRLRQSLLTPWQLHRTNFDNAGKAPPPLPKKRGTASGMRKTKQPERQPRSARGQRDPASGGHTDGSCCLTQGEL